MKRKICIFTGTRAEYGLLKPLIDELRTDNSVELQLIISGMHLSPEFGLTYREINLDGFSKVEKVEILLSSDTPIGVLKSMGLGMISYAEALDRLKPDLLVGLGDRFELFSLSSAALVQKVPFAHIHGGEVTSGAYDDAFRHSITKMSHLHFASTEIYRKRIIQLGENPNTVFNVGALGLDNIKKMKLLSKKDLENSLNFLLDKPYFVVTFHPVTLEKKNSEKQFKELLKALDEFKFYKFIFTKANADNDGRIINNLIDEYVAKNKDRAASFYSLGQLRYLSALKYAEMMIGNSSSGIIEMPFFKKPTINIGERQNGRIFPKSVIQCEPNQKSIITAVERGIDGKFRKSINQTISIYGNGTASKKIKKVITTIDLTKLIKKKFYDIESFSKSNNH
jgi:UDP-hydrolysing UDP-N-acetyl-D-glucosamine 2-epimerase